MGVGSRAPRGRCIRHPRRRRRAAVTRTRRSTVPTAPGSPAGRSAVSGRSASGASARSPGRSARATTRTLSPAARRRRVSPSRAARFSGAAVGSLRAALGGRGGRRRRQVRGLLRSGARRMTDTPRPWDRLTPESDPAYEACAACLDTGSLRGAYRQRSGNDPATPSHRRDSQSASRHAAIREQRQRLREHLIQPGVLERHQVRARHLRLAAEVPPTPLSRRPRPCVSRRA